MSSPQTPLLASSINIGHACRDLQRCAPQQAQRLPEITIVLQHFPLAVGEATRSATFMKKVLSPT